MPAARASKSTASTPKTVPAAAPRPIYTASATGRGGRTATRKTGTTACHFAVDVADPDAKSPAGQAGLIWSFHVSRELAERQAERYLAKELDAKVVEATAAEIKIDN